MAEDKRQYNNLEQVLQKINKQFIGLDDKEVARNANILETILPEIIEKMKLKDQLFKKMFERIFYGGSYYDGLRVGSPTEYDLDLLLTIPKIAEPELTIGNIPGFVHLQLKNFDRFMKQPEAAEYKNFDKLFDNHKYLDTSKVLAWMESVLTKGLNEFPKVGPATYVIRNDLGIFEITIMKSGPALTLKLTRPGGVKIADIDFVTCFVFTDEKWPQGGYRSNPTTKNEFFIVPKVPPRTQENQPTNRYWRLSFQEQERVLINGSNTLKPTIKLLKKLRDTQNWVPIASYYIKTFIMWMTEKKGASFWNNNSLSYTFITAMNEFKDSIESQQINYYWCKKNNLLGKIRGDTLINISKRLNVIISDVIKQLNDDPNIIAKYLLDPAEYRMFMNISSEESAPSNCIIL